MNLGFDFPPVSSEEKPPQWTGKGFIVNNKTVPILEYSNNFQGWNDKLTAFHEDTAGENHFIDCASRQYTIEQIIKYLNIDRPIILEIGCSSGFMLKELQDAKPNATIIGADVVHEPLLNLAKKITDIPLMRFDLLDCPLPDKCVDAVIILNVLEHIQDDVMAVCQIKRILKPGGIAIIEVPAGPHLFDIYDKALMHFRRYSLDKLKKIVCNEGFKILRTSHLGFFVYPGFWLTKKRNQKFFKLCDLEQKKIVENNIKQTGENKFLHIISKIELLLGKLISYPFGIRCLITIQK